MFRWLLWQGSLQLQRWGPGKFGRAGRAFVGRAGLTLAIRLLYIRRAPLGPIGRGELELLDGEGNAEVISVFVSAYIAEHVLPSY